MASPSTFVGFIGKAKNRTKKKKKKESKRKKKAGWLLALICVFTLLFPPFPHPPASFLWIRLAPP